MSLQDIRSECADTAALLQPYVDGELASAEQERVAAHVECCRPCRSAISEQQWVRATLRAVKRDVAPTSLRARILLELDDVDREVVVPAPTRPSWWARLGSAIADAGRGAMIMVPAGAVAVGLFFVAREGFTPAESMPDGLGSALTRVRADAVAGGTSHPTPPRPGASLPPMSPSSLGASKLGELQLVRADVPGTAHPPHVPGARLRYEIVRDGLPTGQHVIDQQAPAGVRPSGTLVEFRGRQFLLDRTSGDEPAVHFELAGVSHMFVLEGAERERDYSVLLELVDQKLDYRVEGTP
jgi:anti-sigma factor (TIGR02949 family)